MTDPETTNTQPWEGVYPLPDALIPRCSWCRKPSEAFFVVVFELDLPAVSRDIQSAVVCAACARVGREYIALRKAGVSHRFTLRDFGIRE